MSNRVLVLAPHPDDETLGCGGTIAKWAAGGADVHVAVVTGHGPDPHPLWPPTVWESVREEARRAAEILGVTLHFGEVPAVLVADQPSWQLNKAVAALIERVAPSTLLVPFPYDLHKDHREIFHAASVAWRASSQLGRDVRRVLCYEVQSETHWNAPYVEPGFLPHLWVDVSDHLETKLAALACYQSQLRPFPSARSLDAVRALAMWRGSQQQVRAAEAFVVIRELE